jgi:hypothetical protein
MERVNSILRIAAVAALGGLAVAGCSSNSANVSGVGGKSYAASQAPRPAYHFADSRPATGKTVFIYDPKQFAWAAYDSQGKLMKTGIGSGGASYCPDLKAPCRTPVGTFTVHREGGPACKSSIFPLGKGGAPMPHCAFFKGGYAVHGSYDVPAYNASHGCVRVTPDAASWLDANVLNPGSTVIIEHY